MTDNFGWYNFFEVTLNYAFILNKILLFPIFYLSAPVILSFVIFSFYISKKHKKKIVNIFSDFLYGFFSIYFFVIITGLNLGSYEYLNQLFNFNIEYVYRILILLLLILMLNYNLIRGEINKRFIFANNGTTFVFVSNPKIIKKMSWVLNIIKFYAIGVLIFFTIISFINLLKIDISFRDGVLDFGQLLIIFSILLASFIPSYLWLKDFFEYSYIYNSAINSPQIESEEKINKQGLFTLQKALIDECGWDVKYFGPYGKSFEYKPDKPSCIINQDEQVRKLFNQYPKNIDLRKIFYVGREFYFADPRDTKIQIDLYVEMQQIFEPEQRSAMISNFNAMLTNYEIIKVDDKGEWFKVKRLNDGQDFYFSFKVTKYPMLIIFDKKIKSRKKDI